ncbi:MAG: hypothetical protein DHS20C17_09430 [Cyclobacteriaceae bacterium]|nr:MAG: hypothetical protein DHS20C17_09430 [Cyclobacteriaceae bacterium]
MLNQILEVVINTDYKKNYLKQLFLIALADAHLDSREEEYLFFIAQKMGINHQEFHSIKQSTAETSLIIPDNYYQRFRMIFDFVWVMMIDGEIDPREKVVCQQLVNQLDFASGVVDDLIEHINYHLSCGINPEHTFAKFEEMLMEK